MFAATIGFFDGVHRGHRCLIEQLKTIASGRRLDTLIVTMKQHPRAVMQSEYVPHLLTTAEEKVRLLEETGVTRIDIIPFDKLEIYYLGDAGAKTMALQSGQIQVLPFDLGEDVLPGRGIFRISQGSRQAVNFRGLRGDLLGKDSNVLTGILRHIHGGVLLDSLRIRLDPPKDRHHLIVQQVALDHRHVAGRWALPHPLQTVIVTRHTDLLLLSGNLHQASAFRTAQGALKERKVVFLFLLEGVLPELLLGGEPLLL